MQVDFDTLYAEVPASQRERLRTFRAQHPYKTWSAEGVRRRYIACGQGAQTLLFLPGVFVGADIWFEAISALESDYRIIAVDTPTDTFALPLAASALVGILEAEAVSQAIVIGLSYGGVVAQYFAQHHPDKVGHLVLTHCAPLQAPRRQPPLQLLQLVPAPLIKWLLRQMGRRRRYPASSAWAAFARAYFRERLPAYDKQRLLRFLEGMMSSAVAFDPQALAGWSGRVWLLSSRDDPMTYPTLPELQARYSQAQTHLFEEGGHHTLLLFPERYLPLLKQMLADSP